MRDIGVLFANGQARPGGQNHFKLSPIVILWHTAQRMTTSARFSLFLLFGAFVFALPFAGRGDDDEGKALGKFLGQHGYGAVPTDSDALNKQFFVCMINGRVVEMTVDTGCGRTCITSDCARSLKLQVVETKHDEWGAGGEIKGHMGMALVNSFKVKDYEINRTSLISVLPHGTSLGADDGLFGYDFLRLNAVILPVGSHLFLFKPGNAPVPSIDSYMTALGFKSLPLHYMKGGLYVTGELNGQPCVALVDCGDEYSTFDLDYVLKVKGGQIMSDALMMKGVDGAVETAFGFRPNHLQFGNLVLDGTELTASKSPTFSHVGFNALIGYDLLAAHEAIIDLGHNALWIK